MVSFISRIFQQPTADFKETQEHPLEKPWKLDPTGSEVAEIELEPETHFRYIMRSWKFYDRDGEYSSKNLRAEFLYQRRGPNDTEWKDPDKFIDARHLKKNQAIKIQLGPNKLMRVFKSLAQRYHDMGGLTEILEEVGIKTFDPKDSTLVTGHSRAILETMVESNPEFWEHLAELKDCEMPSVILSQQTKQKQQAALDQFENHINASDWDELAWQRFFKHNEWIFGLGLSYEYLPDVQSEAYVGGTGIDRRGGNHLDFLRRTDGEHSFTTFVEIKRPDKKLLSATPYRDPNIYRVSGELAGGVSQLQHYCDTFDGRDGETLERIGAETYQPKALLVIGNLSELDSFSKRRTFQLFRRQISNPEIVTFDELLARARYIVNHDGSVGGSVEEVEHEEQSHTQRRAWHRS